MNNFDKLKIQVEAVTRIPIELLAYRARRVFRNLYCKYFGKLYNNSIIKASKIIPTIKYKPYNSNILDEYFKFLKSYSKEEFNDIKNGNIKIFNITKEFGHLRNIDWNANLEVEGDHQLWRLTNCYMDFLVPIIISDEFETQLLAIDVINSFNNQCKINSSTAFKYSWHPYASSKRIINLAIALQIAINNKTIKNEVYEVVSDFLRLNIAFLQLNIELDLGNNHIERNLAALCIYYSLADTIPNEILKTIDREIYNIVKMTILDDGTMIERSAMYQAMSVFSLKIYNCTNFLSPKTKLLVEQMLPKAEHALMFLTHPDGDIALFNDSWQSECPKPSEILNTVKFPQVSILKNAGFARIEHKGIFVLLDAGPIGPSWNPGHGHSDFLSLELDVNGKRLFVDAGTSQYSSTNRRYYEKRMTGHNGPRYEDFEPIEYLSCFRVGRLAEAQFIDIPEISKFYENFVIAKWCVKKHICARLLITQDSGLLIVDVWLDVGSKPITNFLVPSEWEIEDKQNNIYIKFNGVTYTRITYSNCDINFISNMNWSKHYLELRNATGITIAPYRGNGYYYSCLMLNINNIPANLDVDIAQIASIIYEKISID